MIKNIVIGVLVVLTLLFASLYIRENRTDVDLGAGTGYAHYQQEAFLQGLYAGARDQLTIDNTGNITKSGDITVTTTNTATSTITVGCLQTYATSTATAVRFTIGTAANATSTSQGTDANGTVVWQYGSCPI